MSRRAVGPPAPTGTYRVQLTPRHGFAALAAAAAHLERLGVSHAYLSPVLAAAPGSQHGYDVVDHARVNDELGGEDGLRARLLGAAANTAWASSWTSSPITWP